MTNIKKTAYDKLDDLDFKDRITIFSVGELSTPQVFNKLLSLCRKTKQKISITMATWQIGQKHIAFFKDIADDPMIDFRLLLDVSYMDRHKDYFGRIKTWIGSSVWVTKNHSKIMLMAAGDLRYTVLSSANYNKNFRIEFFDITQDKELYDSSLDFYEPFFAGNPITHRVDRPKIKIDFASMARERETQTETSQNKGCPWL